MGGGGNGGGATTTVTTSRVDRLVSSVAIPYMRPIAISLKGQRFRPWASVDVYFNGVNVNKFSGPTLGSLNTQLVADANGNINGVFSVPASTFRTGDGVVVLSDDPNPASAVSYGSAPFRSGGTRNTMQATVTTTTVRTGDPLAQTFYIATKTNSPGCFVTKIATYFQTKDTTQPIELELRSVVNGYPGEEVLASSTVQAVDVSTSANSTVATDFVFSRPVFVENNKQYCFVLKTNSTQYNAWVAELGQNRVDKNEAVAKQPNSGVMFISSNDTTWTPVQTADVKFKVYVAKFETSAPAQLVFAPAFPNYRTAFNANIETTTASSEIRVFAIQHGLQVGSKVMVDMTLPSGVANINGITLANVTGLRTVTKVDGLSFSYNATAGVASASGLFTMATVTYEPNAVVDSVMISQDVTTLTGTSASFEYKGVSGKSVDGTQTPFVQDVAWTTAKNNAVTSLSQPKLITSFSETAARFGGNASTLIRTTLETSDPFVSPFMKMENSGLVAFTHFINNPSSSNTPTADYIDETDVRTGVCQARYVTKPVTLTNPASSVKIRFAANCVQGNFIDVYYRTVGTGETTDISTKSWTVFNPTKTFVNAPDAVTMYDYDYDITGLPEFKTVQVKIVLRGGVSCCAPMIQDLRILALAT